MLKHMTRRDFLAKSGIALGCAMLGGVVAGCSPRKTETPAPTQANSTTDKPVVSVVKIENDKN